MYESKVLSDSPKGIESIRMASPPLGEAGRGH